MRGASRASYAELREQLAAAVPGAPVAAQVGDKLFAVTRLLDSEHGLRRALADSGKPSAEKTGVVRRLLHGRVSEATEGLVAEAAAAHWATAGDFADALEQRSSPSRWPRSSTARWTTSRTTCSGSAA
jgi:F-type H+-transporting ATPase subunit delta